MAGWYHEALGGVVRPIDWKKTRYVPIAKNSRISWWFNSWLIRYPCCMFMSEDECSSIQDHGNEEVMWVLALPCLANHTPCMIHCPRNGCMCIFGWVATRYEARACWWGRNVPNARIGAVGWVHSIYPLNPKHLGFGKGACWFGALITTLCPLYLVLHAFIQVVAIILWC